MQKPAAKAETVSTGMRFSRESARKRFRRCNGQCAVVGPLGLAIRQLRREQSFAPNSQRPAGIVLV